MRQITIFLLISLMATVAFSATKSDLKTILEETGKYVSVSDPAKIPVGSSMIDRQGKKYAIVITFLSDIDSLVVHNANVYVWVENDGDSTEAAYFINGNPTVTIESYYTVLTNYIEAQGFVAKINAVWKVGNKDYAFVTKYDVGSGGVGTLTSKSALVTRVDGGSLVVEIIE